MEEEGQIVRVCGLKDERVDLTLDGERLAQREHVAAVSSTRDTAGAGVESSQLLSHSPERLARERDPTEPPRVHVHGGESALAERTRTQRVRDAETSQPLCVRLHVLLGY